VAGHIFEVDYDDVIVKSLFTDANGRNWDRNLYGDVVENKKTSTRIEKMRFRASLAIAKAANRIDDYKKVRKQN